VRSSGVLAHSKALPPNSLAMSCTVSACSFTLDGEPATALEGDTVLTAILTHRAQLRRNEFSHEPRAGFCLMGACQDCWVMTATGERLRSCATFIQAGMQLTTGGAA